MKTNILNYINKIQGYKTAIKNLHWSSKHMSEHKLLDDIAESVANNQDEIAEMCQGLYGKIKINELKPKKYKITNSKKMLFDMLKDTKKFYSSLKGRELTGIRSVVESFIGELNKFVYLMEMCLKEDIKRNMKTQINENEDKMKTKNLIKINENEIRKLIRESIKNVLNEQTYGLNTESFWDEFNKFTQRKIYSLEERLNEYKKEVELYKMVVQQVLQRIQNNEICGDYVIDMDLDRQTTTIDVILNINGFEDDSEIDKLDNELWVEMKDLEKYFPIEVSVGDEPKNDGKYHVTFDVEYMPIGDE